SIRLPAHFCGVVGLKPTYGAVSRSGLVALASSLDQIGPITRSVEDAELVFEAISGYDPYDNTSTQYEYNQTSVEEVKKLRIGLPKQYFPAELSSEVKTAVNDVISFYESQGFSISMIDMPHTEYGLAAYYIIQPAEASSNLSRFDGIRYAPVTGVERSQHDLKNLYIHNKTLGFGKETKRRIILGTYVLSSGYYDAYYKKAQEAREYIKDDFNNAFEKVDVLLSPVSPTPAFNLGEKINDPVAMYLTDILTIPTNLAGLPAISIPVKTNTHPLPIGFQLIGKHFKENDIIGLGKLYEKSL
ncbi:MAG: Asp-tRNA(Asn)/Glu-tRNA(Gln) amidotransferase subunit GatA, partial [Candidatus Harrisonbacteria bacterium CG10_big_fil_rev_8_21_14_0_10_38_8]